jgi:hypothetical protein
MADVEMKPWGAHWPDWQDVGRRVRVSTDGVVFEGRLWIEDQSSGPDETPYWKVTTDDGTVREFADNDEWGFVVVDQPVAGDIPSYQAPPPTWVKKPAAPSLIERIARVLCAREGRDPDEAVRGEGAAIGETWFGWQAFASDAVDILREMREPSDIMIDAAYVEDVDGYARPTGTWQAMIDAEIAAEIAAEQARRLEGRRRGDVRAHRR